jgi:hypothetical protein
MENQKENLPLIFESADVTALVGVPPVNLNKFIERKLYGLAPSVRAETGRGGRRIFSETDVLGVGLVWWLFESGLRSQTIQCVINEANRKQRQSTANDAATALIEAGAMVLVVESTLTSVARSEDSRAPQRVCFLHEDRPVKFDSKGCLKSVLFVPIGNLFARLRKMISEFRRS